MTRLNLADAIDDLAPPPPPCYLNRAVWIEYLKSCASGQNVSRARKIILIANGQPAINFDYPFCADCSQVHSLAMTKAGRCNPDFLKQQEATKQ